MAKPLKELSKKLASIAGFDIVSFAEAEQIRNLSPAIRLYNALPIEKQRIIARWLPFSRSQLAQDLFVLSEVDDFRHDKYFVEFGATDGVTLSNTYLLETQLGWKGLLAEPAKIWHEKIKLNRSCDIDIRCVSSQSGLEVDFIEVNDQRKRDRSELSGMLEYADNGAWAAKIRKSRTNIYKVKTISLNELLAEYNSPNIISYLSIDTEGSELLILQGLDFSKYKIKVITVEHNYIKKYRDGIRSLLVAKGYIRKYEHLSRWDDWYVLNS